MEVLDAINGRRSIRKYKSKQVPKEIIEKLLDAAVMAPSAVNRQPGNFIIIEDKKKISDLSKAVKKNLGLLGYAIQAREKIQSKEDTIFYGAPLLIIVTAEKEYKWAKIDCGILAQTMFLAAHSMGLGSCYIGFATSLNNDKDVLRELEVPKGHEIIAPLIFGYPDEAKDKPDRRPKIVRWLR
ncbi:MAG: nitroreductase family protein [Candidatus Altiarchaeota archaeon]